jgi:hypothetical protein
MSRIARFLLLAATAVFVALWVAVGDLLGALLSFAVLALASLLVVAMVGFVVSNLPGWWRAVRGVGWDEHLVRLENDGKAIRERYETTRCITFEDLSTGCIAHLLDLGDRGILCLYGQSYFEFEPIDDDPDVSQPRKFPTKNFSLLRRKSNGEVLALYPGADVFEPTVCGGIVGPEEAIDHKLKDGGIISTKSFEDIEQSCKSAAVAARAA